jgi:hypothetical protein
MMRNMALSNWDTFAIDHRGNPCKGEFISPDGIKVRIYKNWLYLSDNSWGKIGERYVRPYSMEIFDSRLAVKDTRLVSLFVRGSIYVAVWSGYENVTDNDEDSLKGMVGIGSSGYSNDKYVGISDKQLIRLRKFLNESTTVCEITIPTIFKDIDFSKGKRFNQGDMFFHEAIGLEKQCSEIGSAEEPILSKIFRKIEGSEK